MGRLEQMGEQGVEIGRLLTQQARFAAVHATTEAVPDNRPHAELLSAIAAAHARVTRAVALAAAVEDRIDKGLPVLPEADRARRVREDLAAEKRARLAHEIDRGLDDAGHRPLPRVRLGVDLMRLLDAETADLDRFLARPFPELAARLRRDLGLKPTADDEAWLGEAAEGAGAPTPVVSLEAPAPPTHPISVAAPAPSTAAPSPSSAGAFLPAIAKSSAIAYGPPSAGRRSSPPSPRSLTRSGGGEGAQPPPPPDIPAALDAVRAARGRITRPHPPP